jgi:hypothetical protein
MAIEAKASLLLRRTPEVSKGPVGSCHNGTTFVPGGDNLEDQFFFSACQPDRPVHRGAAGVVNKSNQTNYRNYRIKMEKRKGLFFTHEWRE